MRKMVSVLFFANGKISQTNINNHSEAWNMPETHRISQTARNFECLSYSAPISQTGITTE